jgi:hypothetical protein
MHSGQISFIGTIIALGWTPEGTPMEEELRREFEGLKQLINDLGAKISAAMERARELESRLHEDQVRETPEEPPDQGAKP